jgi:hypothetical protein
VAEITWVPERISFVDKKNEFWKILEKNKINV